MFWLLNFNVGSQLDGKCIYIAPICWGCWLITAKTNANQKNIALVKTDAVWLCFAEVCWSDCRHHDPRKNKRKQKNLHL
jgi:hypothetical protein